MNPTRVTPDRTPTRTRTRQARGALPAGLLALGLLTGACSGGAADSSGPGATSADVSAESQSGATSSEASDSSASSAAGSVRGVTGDPAAPAQVTAAQRDIISTGTVALQTADVGATLAEVQQVVDRVGGQVTERTSETDDPDGSADGAVTELVRARLVLRVPAARFGDAMGDLEGTAELLSSDTTGQDVTTQVIDTDARVEVARRSIDRVAVLLDRAESIADVVSVEAQLAQREADLASLVQQQTYLGDQSSLSTITVAVRRTQEAAPPQEEKEDRAGFTAGLSSGWDALSGSAVVALTLLGVLLPWLVLLLVVGLPGVALTRRLRRRTPDPRNSPGGPGATTASAGTAP